MKGKTLRTALQSGADTPLSQVEIGASASTPSLLDTILASLEDSKAENIVPINIQRKSSLADFMVIASGRSNRHVGAVADHLLKVLKDSGVAQARVEGMPSADWVLIDAGDVIIHVFRPEVREFYNLEKMWQAPELEDETVH